MIIPHELPALVADQRVIPFIGPGFSAGLGLPDWDQLLAQIAQAVDDTVAYEDIQDYAGDDRLQIAEYLYLRANSSVGPLRHAIGQAFRSSTSLVRSAPHVELANLNAPQIYTTNFDELLEGTFHDLGLPYRVVSLSRDVASASLPNITQIVKFHGDLRHDETLVLTESSYYKRLDFESPMDLKFRSDLLGRSVLFMGYGDRDMNVRVMWLKLMGMMRGVPEKDRLPCFVVRLEPNPVLEALNEAVGLHTIVLDPEGSAKDARARSALLAEFLYRLSTAAWQGRRSPRPLFMSTSYIEAEKRQLVGRDRSQYPARASNIASRTIPRELYDEARPLVMRVLASGTLPPSAWSQMVRTASKLGPGADLTFAVAVTLPRVAEADPASLGQDFPWGTIWQSKITPAMAHRLLDQFRETIDDHSGGEVGTDIAYAADIAGRIASGQIMDDSQHEVVNTAIELLSQAADLYPAISDIELDHTKGPEVTGVLSQIEERREVLGRPEDFGEGDKIELDVQDGQRTEAIGDLLVIDDVDAFPTVDEIA